MLLVRNETTPEDLRGMIAAEGILTAKGGVSSHAALVARLGTAPSRPFTKVVPAIGARFSVPRENADGTVRQVLVAPGQTVAFGATLLVLD